MAVQDSGEKGNCFSSRAVAPGVIRHVQRLFTSVSSGLICLAERRPSFPQFVRMSQHVKNLNRWQLAIVQGRFGWSDSFASY